MSRVDGGSAHPCGARCARTTRRPPAPHRRPSFGPALVRPAPPIPIASAAWPASTPSPTTLSETWTPSASSRRSAIAGARSRRSSTPRSPGPSGSSTELNALAPECFEPRTEPRRRQPRGGYFAGVPTFVKDNSDLAGLPTMQGTDAFAPVPAKPTATSPGCSWPPEWSRWARPACRSTASAPRRSTPPGTRPVTVVDRAHRRRLVLRVGSAGRRAGPSRSRTRTTAAARSASRRRSTASSASSRRGDDSPGPDVPSDARPARGRRGGDPVGARHGRVPARGGEGLPRPEARADRGRHPCRSGSTDGSRSSPTASTSGRRPRSRR